MTNVLDETAVLDRALEISKTFEPQVVEELKKTHDEDQADVRRVRNLIIRRLVGVTLLAIGVMMAILLIGSLLDIARPAPSSSLEQIVRAWSHFHGVVTPGLALSVNFALLALVGSINLAVAAATRGGDRREEVMRSLWYRMLTVCASASAVGAVGFSILQTGGLNDKSDYGVAIAAAFIGLVTAFLAVTLVEYSTAVDRARDFADASRQRQDIVDWVSLIRGKGVPVSFPAGPGLRLRRFPRVPRAVAAVAIFTAGSVAYCYGIIEIVSLWLRGRLFIPHTGWSDVWFGAYIVAYSAAIAYLIGGFAWRRWAERKTRFLRWRLAIWPLLVRVVTISAWVLLFLALGLEKARDWPQAILVTTVAAGPFLVMPCVAWIVLWQSRKLTLRRSQPTYLLRRQGWAGTITRKVGDTVLWLAEPVWHNVGTTLESYYRNHTSRRDRAYDHELGEDT